MVNAVPTVQTLREAKSKESQLIFARNSLFTRIVTVELRSALEREKVGTAGLLLEGQFVKLARPRILRYLGPWLTGC